MSDLVKRLRIKAGMIEMGERIAWGSDSALMREAADALEMAAPAVQGDPVAYAVFADNGNVRIWCADPIQVETLRLEYGDQVQPLYAAPKLEPDVSGLVEALELFMSNPALTSEDFDRANAALAAHRKGGEL